MTVSGGSTPSPSPSSTPRWRVWTPTPRPEGAQWVVHGRVPLRESGSLDEIPLPELFYACFVEAKSGVLKLEHRGRIEKLAFSKGRLVSSPRLESPSMTFGDYLLRRGLLDQSSYEALTKERLLTREQWPSLVARRGLLDPHALYDALTAYETKRIVELFQMTKGRFEFESNDELLRDVVPLALETPRLVLDGIVIHYDDDRLARVLSIGDSAKPRLRSHGVITESVLRPTTNEARILEMARHGKAFREILAAFPEQQREVRAFFAALFIMKTVGFELDEPLAESPRTESPTGSFISELEHMEKASDYFVMLGVKKSDTPTTIRRAFRRRSKRCHPDTLVRFSQDLRDRGDRVYRKLATAQEVLSDPNRRQRYLEERIRDASAAHGSPRPQGWQKATGDRRRWKTPPQWSSPAQERKEARARAAKLADEARQDLYAKRPVAAADKLRRAMKLNHESVEHEAWYAWALYLSDPDVHLAESTRRLRAAERRSPRAAVVQLLIARVYESQGELEQAWKRFTRARELADGDEDIEREARLYEFRLRRGRPRLKADLQIDVDTIVERILGSRPLRR